jgi:hypothetical protein
MGCLLSLSLLASVPLLWFFPKTMTVVAGSAWLLLFLIVFLNNRTINFTSSTGILSQAEAELASKYGFYFRMPHPSVGISNGCAAWQMFSFLWLGFLAYKQLWWFMIIPAAAILICMYLRPTCHPGFFAQQGAERYSGTLQGHQFAQTMIQLQAIYDKLWGSERISPEAVGGPTLSSHGELPSSIDSALADLEAKHPVAVSIIRDAVVAAIRQSKQEVLRQLEEGLILPHDVARQFSCNIAGDQLEEGRHHIYRGTLTEGGRALLTFYADCWREDARRNFTTTDEAEEEIAAMHNIVRTIG